MNAKKVVPLVISLVAALVVLVWGLRMMSNKTSIGLAPRRPQVVMVKTPVNAGSVINEEQLVMGEVGLEIPPETVFQNIGQLVGRVPAIPLMPGQIVTASSLTPKGTGPGLPSLIPTNMRAVTLDINEITGVAGNIVPGSHVDIIQTMRDPQTAEPMTRLIAQDVKVAATGMPHGPDGGDGGGRSITVYCSPQQALLLEMSAMNGRARMALRGSNDNTSLEVEPVTLAMFLGKKIGTPHDPVAPVPVVAASTQPSTQPSLTPTFVKAEPEETPFWKIEIVRSGGAPQEVKFAQPRAKVVIENEDAGTSQEPIQK